MPRVKKAVKYVKRVLNYYGKGRHKYIYTTAQKGGEKAAITLKGSQYTAVRGGRYLKGGKAPTLKKFKMTPSSKRRVQRLMEKAGFKTYSVKKIPEHWVY